MILCGDFNTEPSSSDLAEIREALPYFYSSLERTYSEDHGRPPIDFFCSSVALEVNISVFPADGLSDHNIVVATFNGIGSPCIKPGFRPAHPLVKCRSTTVEPRCKFGSRGEQCVGMGYENCGWCGARQHADCDSARSAGGGKVKNRIADDGSF